MLSRADNISSFWRTIELPRWKNVRDVSDCMSYSFLKRRSDLHQDLIYFWSHCYHVCVCACVCVCVRATGVSWLLSSAGALGAGLFWKIIASPYTPATSVFRTTKGFPKGCLSPPTEVWHMRSRQLFWPQFNCLWIVNTCTALTEGVLDVKGVLIPISVPVGMSWTVFWPLLTAVSFHVERQTWRISLDGLWSHNHRMAIFEVGSNWQRGSAMSTP